MRRITDEGVIAHTQAVLEWIREPTYREMPACDVLLGLLLHGGTITQAREDEFVDAILHATANLPKAIGPVFSYACDRGSMRLVQLLLSMGGVDCTASGLAKPLTLAAYGGHVGIVQYVLAHAETPLNDEVYLRMLKDAVDQGHLEVVEYLLQIAGSNVDVNVSAEYHGGRLARLFTFLERAILEDRVEVAAALLSHGASGLHDTPEIVKWVPSVAMAELLYAHGADFSGEGGLEAAISSIERGGRALLQVLLARGADIRRFLFTRKTPFHAVFTQPRDILGTTPREDPGLETARRLATIDDLFACMIDIDARDEDGLATLQSIAADTSYEEADKDRLVKQLVDLGASSEDCEGW